MIGEATFSLLPAGLLDDEDNGELFSHKGKEYATLSGCVVPYSHFPHWLLDEIDLVIERDSDISASLIEADIVEPDSARRQVVRCLYGVFDGKADIKNRKLQQAEYWNCSSRGNCPYEGRLCKAVKVSEGVYLTPREVDVLKLIDLQANEIADKLGIAESTVPKFKSNIFQKLKMNRTGDLIKFAISKNLIQIN